MWKRRSRKGPALRKDWKGTSARASGRRKLRRESSEMKKFGQNPSDKREALEDSSTSATSSPSRGMFSTENSSEVTEVHSSAKKKLTDVEDARKWTLVQTRGTNPAPRFNHAAAVVGRKLLVVGGEDGLATRNDVQTLHLGKLSWSKVGVGDSAPSNGLPAKTGPVQELPNCRGHSLVTWGKTVILIGGQSPTSSEDRISVWSFDLELDCWRSVVTKGKVPAARSGQTVTRAGSILIMFGGEDAKGRKLNDLSILDLKSLMWLPLHPTGKGPSPRARHVADMFDDRFLFIFGGETKSKVSNDIFALDFENMEWSRLKTRGVLPVPRAGHAGALVGSMWYIAGGVSRAPGPLDTTVLDMSRMEWSVVAPPSEDPASSLQGLSLIFIQRKERRFLVAFGGLGAEPSNAVHVLHIPVPEHPPRKTLAGLLELPTTPEPRPAASRHSEVVRSQHGPQPTLMGAAIPCACISVADSNLDPVVERRPSTTQRWHSKPESYYSADLDRNSGLIPLRTRYAISQSSRIMPPTEKLSFITDTSSPCKSEQWPPSQPLTWDSISATRRKDLSLPSLKSSRRLPAVTDSEDCKRQHQRAQRNVKAGFQSTPPAVDAGLLLSAEELQISGPSVRPGLLSSVRDAGGKLFPPPRASVSSGSRSGQGGSQSSEFSGYAETFVSRNGETHLSEPTSTSSSINSASPSHGVTNIPNECHSPSKYSDKYVAEYENAESPGFLEVDSSPSLRARSPADGIDEIDQVDGIDDIDVTSEGCVSLLFNGTADVGEEELAVVTRIQTAANVEERRAALEVLVQHQERKLTAAMRTGELLAGQCAEALRDRDEAERSVHIIQESRQRIEGRLTAALKQIKELKERLMVTEHAREESSVLVRNTRVENMKLEHDLALKTALLGESQKELQVTRGHLVAEGTRAFQLQVELIDLKQKVQNTAPQATPIVQCLRQPILA